MSGEKKETYHHHDQPPPYGTFQGVANHPPPTVIGFPQPVPPPGLSGAPPPPSQYYAHGYQAVVPEGRPLRERRLPCCGIGFGWFLFIIGFFLGSIPWFIGVFLILFSRIDPREKPGYVACTIAAVLATFAFILGLTRIDF
ncbi:hypothetical protein CASFOL_007510 [Castilleja foliolosa]|uniref:60S ribosomal protein L18a-like protein n=1 Tax=Castilleja foliolosa TaxID=1961234 RepID=A0ABD3EA69_9LAMI